MKKLFKTTGIITTMAILLEMAYLMGEAQSETVTEIQTASKVKEAALDGYIDMKSEEFINNYVDMRQVTYWEVSDDGLQLYYEDGSGYYWE